MGLDRLDKVAGAQVVDAIAKGADAGEDKALGFGNDTRVGGHLRAQPDAFKALLHTAQITHAVINNGHHLVKTSFARTHPLDARIELGGVIESTPQRSVSYTHLRAHETDSY